jgi:hypothetical protein
LKVWGESGIAAAEGANRISSQAKGPKPDETLESSDAKAETPGCRRTEEAIRYAENLSGSNTEAQSSDALSPFLIS